MLKKMRKINFTTKWKREVKCDQKSKCIDERHLVLFYSPEDKKAQSPTGKETVDLCSIRVSPNI